MAKVLWGSFVLCTLAWLGLFAAPSTNTGNYAGYAVIGYLMLGVVPALTLLLALAGQFIARARVPLAVVSGLVTAGLAVTSAPRPYHARLPRPL